jgi:hypothetical protein
MKVEPLKHESSEVVIKHVQGQKDQYKVEVEPKGESWSPTNEEFFALLHMWYVAEEASYSSGYGKTMPWFYNTLCYLGRDGYLEAVEANQKRGKEQLDYFEETVSENISLVEKEIQKLKGAVGIEEGRSDGLLDY